MKTRAGTSQIGPLHPFALFVVAWEHHSLIRRMAWRRIESRFKGSILGLLWAVIQPLMMLCIYTFVFSVVFKAKWDLPEGGNAQFAILLFSGLILYNIFAECINEAPGLMLSNQVYLKQMLFPVEILSWVSLYVALFNFSISFLLLAGFYCFVHGFPPETVVYFPLVIPPLALMTLGMNWLLSSLGVFFRDISQITGILTTVLLFLSPIFYPASVVPESFRTVFLFNPLAVLLKMSKQSLFYGQVPDLVVLAGMTLGAWLVAWGGYCWFMKTKKGFTDVL